MPRYYIELNDDVDKVLEDISKKYGVDKRSLLNKLVNNIVLHELSDVVEYMESHNYGNMDPVEKIINATLDLFELGFITFNVLEEQVMEVLDAKNYWLEDFSIDFDDRSIWLLFTGTGVIEEFTVDIDPDGVSIIAVHSIEDVVEENPSIEDRIGEVIEKYSSEKYEVSYSEQEIRIVARAHSLSDLPKINELENVVTKILRELNISPDRS